MKFFANEAGSKLRAGDMLCLPVELLSSVVLSNVAFLVTYPAERLTNSSLLINTQQVAGAPSVSPAGPGTLTVGLGLLTNHTLRVPTNVASLCFTAPSNQSSTFVRVQLPMVNAQRSDGATVTNSYGLPGRVVIVGEEPLLEALRAPTNQVLLLQYAIPGSTIHLEWTTNLPPFGGWQPFGPTTQTNLVQEAGRFNPNAPVLFFHAVRN